MAALRVEVSQPSESVKSEYLKKIVAKKESENLRHLQTMMSSLFPSNQQKLQKSFSGEIWKQIQSIYRKSEPFFVYSFISTLVPQHCDIESSEQMDSFIQAEKNLRFGYLKALRGMLFENNRCIKMRQKLLSSKSSAPATSNL